MIDSSSPNRPTSPLLGTPATDLVLAVSVQGPTGPVVRTVRIEAPKCTIGASPTCTLRLRRPGVDPLHCIILRGARGTIVRRWSPATQLNGAAFADAPLNVGDCLHCGPLTLEVLDHNASRLPGAMQHQVAGEPVATELLAARRQIEQDRLALSAMRQTIAQLRGELAARADRPAATEPATTASTVDSPPPSLEPQGVTPPMPPASSAPPAEPACTPAPPPSSTSDSPPTAVVTTPKAAEAATDQIDGDSTTTDDQEPIEDYLARLVGRVHRGPRSESAADRTVAAAHAADNASGPRQTGGGEDSDRFCPASVADPRQQRMWFLTGIGKLVVAAAGVLAGTAILVLFSLRGSHIPGPDVLPGVIAVAIALVWGVQGVLILKRVRRERVIRSLPSRRWQRH